MNRSLKIYFFAQDPDDGLLLQYALENLGTRTELHFLHQLEDAGQLSGIEPGSLVLVDLDMRHPSGVDIFDRVRAMMEGSAARLVCLKASAHPAVAGSQFAKDAGIPLFVKPENLAQLNNLAHELLLSQPANSALS